MKLANKKPNKLRRNLRILATVLVLAVGAIGYWYFAVYQTNQVTPSQEPDTAVVTDDKFTTKSQFAYLSERPVRIMISKIGVDAKIIPVGLTGDGMMDAPATNDLVGWYDQSAPAGEGKYAMLLDGHYGTDTDPAVFSELSKLAIGDIIQIQAEQGAVLTYEIAGTDQQRVEDVDMHKAMYPYQDSEQSLTIITCDGLYDPVNIAYDRRTIVYAQRIE